MYPRIDLLRLLVPGPCTAALWACLAGCAEAEPVGHAADLERAVAPSQALFLVADASRSRVGEPCRLTLRRGARLDAPTVASLDQSFDPCMARVGGFQRNLLVPELVGGVARLEVVLPAAGDAMAGFSTLPELVGGVSVARHAKALFFVARDPAEVPRSSAALSYRLGLRLEIVPMVDPLPLDPGDSVPIQVRFDGPELAGARIDLHFQALARHAGAAGSGVDPAPPAAELVLRATADEVGSLDLPLARAGRYLVCVVHVESRAPRAPIVHHGALTFEIGGW